MQEADASWARRIEQLANRVYWTANPVRVPHLSYVQYSYVYKLAVDLKLNISPLDTSLNETFKEFRSA
jgi:hypothetical protein